MNHTKKAQSSRRYGYIRSLRDSIKYPLIILCITAIYDMCAGAFTWSMFCDYIASIAIFPLAVFISDYIPPHIAENYTLFTNPGMKRVIKTLVFAFVATGCMFCVYLLLPNIFYSHEVINTSDSIERLALLMGNVSESIKFLP